MYGKGVMDVLLGTSEGIARRFIQKTRASPNLKAMNALTDEELATESRAISGKLARWFEKEADKNEIGAFFVGKGKLYSDKGLPLSELVFSLLLKRKAVSEELQEESLLDSSGELYTVVDITNQVADFFFLASYYMTKGYLEGTFLRMKGEGKANEETLRRFFKDDFFFKK